MVFGGSLCFLRDSCSGFCCSHSFPRDQIENHEKMCNNPNPILTYRMSLIVSVDIFVIAGTISRNLVIDKPISLWIAK